MKEILLDSLLDCLRLLPFLFLTYLAVEYIEHRMSARTKEWIYRAGKAGPLLGSLIGLIPQCGFSAAAAGLFAAGYLSPGTLIAVFLSTSDEMLPLMLTEQVPLTLIVRILAGKAAAALVIGYLVDFAAIRLKLWKPPMVQHPVWKYSREPGAYKPIRWKKRSATDVQTVSGGSIVLSALAHTGQIAVFLFLISLILGFGLDWFTGTAFADGIFRIPGLQEAFAALIGMIPNCAASVFITQIYLSGVIRSGAMFAGLLTAAGTGLLVLFRENKSRKQDFAILAALFISGIAAGLILGSLGIV